MDFDHIRQKALAAIIAFVIQTNIFGYVFARCQSYRVFVSPLVVRKLPEGIFTKPSFFRMLLSILCTVPLPSFKPLRVPLSKIGQKTLFLFRYFVNSNGALLSPQEANTKNAKNRSAQVGTGLGQMQFHKTFIFPNVF